MMTGETLQFKEKAIYHTGYDTGYATGRAIGAAGIIAMGRDMGATDEQIRSHLMTGFDISKEEAEQYLADNQANPTTVLS